MGEDQQSRSASDKIQQLEQEISSLRRENQQLRQDLETLQESLRNLKVQMLRERLIDEIANHVRQSLDLDDILQTAVLEVRRFLNVDRVIIYRFKDDWSGVVTIESIAPGASPILYSTFEEPCFREGYVERYQAGRVRAIDDIDTEDLQDCYRALLQDYQVRANLVVPILQGDNTLWGLLIAHHCRAPRHWDELDIRLLRHLSTQLGIAIKQSELYARLRRLASTDELTQLANRRRFDTYLRDVWQQHQRQQTSIAVVLADIDFFKRYNDFYGHPAGDACLETVGRTLAKVAKRAIDLVARYGGEEFAVILPDTDRSGALEVATEMQSAIATLDLKHPESPFAQVTLSCGVAAHIPQIDDSPDNLIKRADQALYQAKAAGRNRIN